LAVGDRLPNERELATQFGVSRQSVREALRLLEGFGVLAARRGAGPESGWTVSGDGTSGLSAMLDLYSTLRGISLADLLEVRDSLEMLSARSAAVRATPHERAALVAVTRDMAAITGVAEFLAADAEFHVMIARASANNLTPLLMEAIRESMGRVMQLAFSTLTDWESERKLLASEHLDIANKIKAGHDEAAAQAVHAHICGFYGRVLSDVVYPTRSASQAM
jgi:GntR family transcriptional repressor for pyruvate dehydrogenase complex